MSATHPQRKHGSRNRRPLRMATLACAVLAGLSMLPAHAAENCTEDNLNGCVELSPTPPQNTTAIPPNIVLILDDSGSMQWNYMPDSGYLNYTTNALINSSNNYVYYDPTVEYTPPPKADGSLYPEYTDITHTPFDGFSTYLSYENITTHPGSQQHYNNSFPFYRKVYGKHYFVFATGNVSSQTMHYVASSGQGCVSNLSHCVTEDDTSGAAAPEGIRAGTNIANWFAYYHNRILMAKSGLMTALVSLSPNYRFGFGAINNRNSNKLPHSVNTGINIAEVRPFGDGSNGTQKKAFWDWLASMDPNGGTPLRRALEAAGKYYEKDQPWQTMEGDPNYVKGGNNSEKLACRASYTVLTTDGFWNGSNPTWTVNGAASEDGEPYTNAKGDTVKYEAEPPYSGGSVNNSASLADVAAYYWKKDLKTNIDNLVPANNNDPAFWQHMTTFTMGIGFSPVERKNGPEIPMDDIFSWARGGDPVSGFSWPTPSSDNVTNIADMAHAAVTGHGDFFSAKNPQELANGFARAIAQITERNVAPQASSVNAGVAVSGALTFNTGYNTSNWNGTFQAVELKGDSSTGEVKWDAGEQLDSRSPSSRKVYTASYEMSGCGDPANATGTFAHGLSFTASNSGALDCVQTAGLGSPAFASGADNIKNRIDYLLGSDANKPLYRQRDHRLGAIINSQPLYVSYPASGYYDTWPANSPEANARDNGKSYSKFKVDHADREGTVYIGANDGMLHAFSAPAPQCTTTLSGTTCDYGNGGKERWAFVPRAVYANLGNLTNKADFRYRPTVDGTPISRDIFFSQGSSKQWQTILVGGVGLGGRGVYALNITDQDDFAADDVLWEFDSDMDVGNSCYATFGDCKATDLGYTVPQSNIGRLANGRWVVVVPNGYFPDCSQPDTPTHEPEQGNKAACKAIAAQTPREDNKPYSALFVLDAETGKMLAELKTPTDIQGVSSFGLGSVVLGDYNNDQIDDVAFAGDLQGNLWRFDLSSANTADWTVTLAYKGKTGKEDHQGIQPITAMPRLFPDPATNRFIVVVGTGKYLGSGDNTTDIPPQAVYGIRDVMDSNGHPVTVTHDDLQEQTLSEDTVSTGDFAGATGRKLTADSLAPDALGWYFDLETAQGNTVTNAGERVVVTAGALFSTNTAVVSTLIPGNDNYCDPSVTGAIMSLDATNGGPSGNGLSIFGGSPYVGARVSHVRTGGSLPMVSTMGGGTVYLPGTTILGTDSSNTANMQIDSPIWRRRSWSNLEIQP